MKELIIPKKYDKKDIYSVLKKEFPHLSTSNLNKAFRLKDIKVNDIRVNKDYIVHTNDICKIYIVDKILNSISKDIMYYYEDENIIIAYKPKGIVSNFENGFKNPNVIYFDEVIKKEKGECIKILNRLDTNTEGLVLFSKNDISYKELLNAFKSNRITKEYLCLVSGKMPKKEDILSHYILKNEKDGISKIYNAPIKNSKTCITKYKEEIYNETLDYSILRITLLTGRTHQIRAHMKYIKHPVIGDSKYGENIINNKFKIYNQVLYSVKYGFNFEKFSPLFYLNDISVDISKVVLDKINDLLKKL